jgi:hypothetical protein
MKTNRTSNKYYQLSACYWLFVSLKNAFTNEICVI